MLIPNDRVLSKFADDLIGKAMERLTTVLTHYDAKATESEPLVIEMRKLRTQGLQFFLFHRASKGLLRTITRRLAVKARIEGYDAEVNVLKMELHIAETDSILFEADELLRSVGYRPKKLGKTLTRIGELNVFLRACLSPVKSMRNKRAFEKAPRMYAKAMRDLVSSSTREIYNDYRLKIPPLRILPRQRSRDPRAVRHGFEG